MTAERTDVLIVGAGVTGLATAARLRGHDYRVVEASDEVGGWCKTVRRDGFVWDYSGHFFHFKRPEIERWLVERMGDQRVLVVEKDARILWGDGFVDFPFQKNIHQLSKEELVDCLYDLWTRPTDEPRNFREMLYAKFGASIADKFLVPYNEKLYATDLANLDVDAMGRFFPHADVDAIIRNFRAPDNTSYNATFTYPEGGAIQYVRALESEVDGDRVRLGERLEAVDLRRKVARTSRGEIAFEHLVSSAPFPALVAMTGLEHDPSIYDWNKVLVFNLGFDRKGLVGPHWVYVPQRELSFYRVGFYDNIFGTDRMSLYVEIGLPKDADVGPERVEAQRTRVLEDLRRAGFVDEHRLVASHSVVLDPAYVHITRGSRAEVARIRRLLGHRGVHSIGRYGGWTYCSIEDNVVEAWALADELRRVL